MFVKGESCKRKAYTANFMVLSIVASLCKAISLLINFLVPRSTFNFNKSYFNLVKMNKKKSKKQNKNSLISKKSGLI